MLRVLLIFPLQILLVSWVKMWHTPPKGNWVIPDCLQILFSRMRKVLEYAETGLDYSLLKNSIKVIVEYKVIQDYVQTTKPKWLALALYRLCRFQFVLAN